MIALRPLRMRGRIPYARILFYTFMLYLNTQPFLIERLEPVTSHRLIMGYQIPNPRRPVFVLTDLFIKSITGNLKSFTYTGTDSSSGIPIRSILIQ